ncbi:MAG TPA: hypothetical protein VKV73_28555 [Chloroflexota bacterium]|nr:hypothetical protein [Chloroflexota bacterium]
MQTPNLRYFVLTAVLLAGAGLYAAFGEPLGAGSARWPVSDAVYMVQPWSVGREAVDEHTNHAGLATRLVTRVFRNPDGGTATLTVLSNQAPKLYGAGAEVPFLGGGYTVEPGPASLEPGGSDGVNALVANRGPERWLVMYAYGERRGLLGNGPLPWTLAVFDGVLGHPNDYYKLYLAARTDQLDPQVGQAVAALAHTLFPRIAAWYAA